MSGISDIKKKAKLSIDEMYDNQIDGKMDFQEESNKGNHQYIKEEFQNNSNPSNHMINKQENQTYSPMFSSKQTQKSQTYKMTFNLSEEIYKGFNDLYAQRILQGRKTDKSELISEAIQWLLKMEEMH